MLGFIINSLNGSTVLVTADHGFMYQESALDEADKAALGDKPAGTLRAKKRYLLGRTCAPTPRRPGTATRQRRPARCQGGQPRLLGAQGGDSVPLCGRCTFVHGSAMPQEVIVPLITVRENETDKAKTRQVEHQPARGSRTRW